MEWTGLQNLIIIMHGIEILVNCVAIEMGKFTDLDRGQDLSFDYRLPN